MTVCHYTDWSILSRIQVRLLDVADYRFSTDVTTSNSDCIATLRPRERERLAATLFDVVTVIIETTKKLLEEETEVEEN